MRFFLIIFIQFFFIHTSGQSPDIVWVKNYGGSGFDVCHTMEHCKDGGMLFIGSTKSADFDLAHFNSIKGIWIVKTDSAGTILWDKLLSKDQWDIPFILKESGDGSIYMASGGYHPDSLIRDYQDLALAKFDKDGNSLWTRYYGGSSLERNGHVSISPDGDIFVSADSYSDDGVFNQNNGYSDSWLMHLDSAGNILWKKNIGGSGNEQIADIQYANDGGVYGFIETSSDSLHGMKESIVRSSPGMAVTVIFKLNKNGNYEWNKQMDFVISHPTSLHLLKFGGLIAVSKLYSIKGSISVMKISPTGTKLWYKILGDFPEFRTEKIELTKEQGFLLIGNSITNGNSVRSMEIIKLDSNGRETWSKTIDGDEFESSCSGFQLSSGEIVVSGNTNSKTGDVSSQFGDFDIFLTKLGIEQFQISAPRIACSLDTVLFLSNSSDSLDWYFRGKKMHTGYSYYHPIEPETFEITIDACVSKFGLTKCDSHLLKVLPPPSFTLASNISACLGDSVEICISGEKYVDKFTWFDQRGESCRNFQVQGTYTILAENAACSTFDSLEFSNYTLPSFSLIQTNLPCLKENAAQFMFQSNEPLLVNWNNGQGNGFNYSHSVDSLFIVHIEDRFGCQMDTAIRPNSHCDFFNAFPNSFSPNNDGLNDVYGPYSEEYAYYKMSIYDRWGALVFESVNKPWDGEIHNIPAPPGIYAVKLYIVPKELQNFFPIYKRLTITLIR